MNITLIIVAFALMSIFAGTITALIVIFVILKKKPPKSNVNKDTSNNTDITNNLSNK